ncbi:MAG: DUF309 domain-containing protein [Acidobacteriota bacterium]|nr:DUF309 domain-containing protein [Acidobacteriota bacterium]
MLSACTETPPPALRRGIALFNQGEFFAQHEILEDLWREEFRPIRRLYQGILQIGVALYHIQRHNYHGAVVMLNKGPACLRPFTPACQGIDVADLLARAARILEAVERLGPNHLGEFDWSLAPSIRLVHRQQR